MEINLIQFYSKFSNEQSCRDYLEEMRWSGKACCPRCASTKVYKFKDGAIWKCGDCGRQFTVRIGTLFEESRIPLQKWFLAIFLATSLKKGISSVQLSKYLGITQKSAWFMLQRLREAFEQNNPPFFGDITEGDETYFGTKGHKRGRSTVSKSVIIGIVGRYTKKVVAKVAKRADAKTLQEFISQNVSKDSFVMTDEWRGYSNLKNLGYNHLTVNHGAKEYVNGEIHTNNIENFWGGMKRGIRAIQYHVSKKHLMRYINEYVYKYNTREMTDFERFNNWFSFSKGRLTYQFLIK